MRLPRMTTRRWMVLIAVVAVDLTLIAHRFSHPLATIGTLAVVVLSLEMLLLLILSADD